MSENERIEKAVLAFIDNEDVDEGSEQLRIAITNIKQLRFAVAHARQRHPAPGRARCHEAGGGPQGASAGLRRLIAVSR